MSRKKVFIRLKNISHPILVNIQNIHVPLDDYKEIIIIANVFVVSNKRPLIYSISKCKPTLNKAKSYSYEEIIVSSIASSLLTINIIGNNKSGQEVFIGQVSLDIAKNEEIYKKDLNQFTFSSGDITHPVYNIGGKLYTFSKKVSSGTVSLSINIPYMFNNICGTFWEIQENFLGSVKGLKIWVVIRNKMLYCYDSQYENKLIKKIECKNISDVTKSVYDKIEIKIQILVIKYIDENFKENKLMWAWGSDITKCKGMWKRLLDSKTPK